MEAIRTRFSQNQGIFSRFSKMRRGGLLLPHNSCASDLEKLYHYQVFKMTYGLIGIALIRCVITADLVI